MIKTLVAYTGEMDDAQTAVSEILTQLDLKANRRKNTVGIIACHYEFVLSGVVRAVCDALPFDVAGTITSAQAVYGVSNTLLLTLMVLTSDEDEFSVRLTEPLLAEPNKLIAETYRDASQGRDARPALIFSFAPFMTENSGDEYVSTITKASGGVSCFGTLAVDDTSDFANCFLIYNGEYYRDRMAMILVYGDLHPQFFIATISPGKILSTAALVTKSSGHILMEVNDRPVVEYFESLGLTKASETAYAMTSLPFLLDYGDGTPPVSKVFISLTPDKYALCAGMMPEGSTMCIGAFDKEDVLYTTGQAMEQMCERLKTASGLLIYSCISRNMSMGSDLLAELDLIRGKIDVTPFMMAYSGGEMCPTQVNDKKSINRFHNNAFIACVF